MSLHPNKKRGGQGPARDPLKRLFDITVSGIGIVVFLPLLAIIALMVYVDSRGPVLYRGIRTGLKGQPFCIYKFRTMIANAEQVGGPTTAKGDPRITRIGKILRRYKLDELPQFWNVLKGEMSIVGPRPEVQECTIMYEGDEKLILEVRPGITDYASIQYIALDEVVGSEDPFRSYMDIVYKQKNKLRVKYIKDYSFMNDLKIIRDTLAAMVKKLI